MATKIIESQINASTRALMTTLSLSQSLTLQGLNQTQINALGTPAVGTMVFNTTADQAQIWVADARQGVPGWTDVGGGGPSVGEKSIIRTNGTNISENLTVGPVANGGAEFTNGFTAGPVQVDNNYTVTIENGASWLIMGGEDNDLREGEIVQVRMVHSSPTRYLIRSQDLDSSADIPELEISIQPTHTNSKILLVAMINCSATHVTSFGFSRDGSLLTSGLSGNSNVGAGSISTVYDGQDTTDYMYNHHIIFRDSPGVTVPVRYRVRASASWSGSVRDLYINDRVSNDMRSISAFYAMEIRG
jgi:hypothetical protein